MLKKIAFCLVFVLSFTFLVKAQDDQSITFKFPKGVMPMNWGDGKFKGVLMLVEKAPAAVFITYPDKGESIDALKNRAKKYLVPMFVQDDKKSEKYEWESFEIPKHEGDTTANYYLYKAEKNPLQLLIYEKRWKGLDLIYGYVAMGNEDDKKNDASEYWANKKGEKVKIFDEFWKTLPTK